MALEFLIFFISKYNYFLSIYGKYRKIMNLKLKNLRNKLANILRESLDAPLYVEYLSQMSGEVPFEKGGRKYEYVWAKYPDGKRDIGVYSFSEDLVYNYTSWRKMVGIDKEGIGASNYDRHLRSDMKAGLSEDDYPITVDDIEPELDFADQETEPDFRKDAFIQNVISGGYDVSVSGKHIGHYDEYNKAVSGLNLELKRRNYFPTIWFVTDHGNYWAIDENGNEIKDNLQERISSNLFKSAINVSKERGTDRRTERMGSLFFNEFVGKPLMGGVIEQITVNNPQQGNYRQVSIHVKYNNPESESKYSFIYYDIDKDNYNFDDRPIDRRDARLLSLIALKINPDSKYKEIAARLKDGWSQLTGSRPTDPSKPGQGMLLDNGMKYMPVDYADYSRC